MSKRFFALIAVLVLISGQAWGATLTVHWNGRLDFATIQEAIDAAAPGDEVVVERGVYRGEGNFNLDFGGKAIVVRSTDPSDDDVVMSTVIDCQRQGRAFIFQNGEGLDSVVDGFAITNGWDPDYGGGIECDGASPTISNCVISNCNARDGGAIDCFGGASPLITGCVFENNVAYNDGGAIECYDGSNPEIFGCIFIGNSAGHWGGAIDSYTSVPKIINCEFFDNSAINNGGAVSCVDGGSAAITNCLMVGNSAGQYGGAIDAVNSNPVISYCTIVNNTGGENFGGVGGISADELSVLVKVTSCILIGNGANLSENLAISDLVTYSCIEGGHLEPTNIDVDPQFRTGDSGEYYLSQRDAGQRSNSGCVNAGSVDLVTEGFVAGDYTTRTDNQGDEDEPDIGYHYASGALPEIFELTADIVPDPADPNLYHGRIRVDGSNVDVLPFVGSYVKYSEVPLYAIPYIDGNGYRVQGWEGVDIEIDDYMFAFMTRLTVTMLYDREVSVGFKPTEMHILHVEVMGDPDDQHGSVVAVTGAAIDGQPGDSWQYANRAASMQAYPDTGYQVRFWQGTYDDLLYMGSESATAWMDVDKTVYVEFVSNSTAHLDAIVVGGHGSVFPKRRNVDVGTRVELWAIPDEHYQVAYWFGVDEENIPEPNAIVVMNWSKVVRVIFEPIPYRNLIIEVELHGDGEPHGYVADPNGAPFRDGDTIKLEAFPDDGYEVDYWLWTDDDTSKESFNFVTFEGEDIYVRVRFREKGMDEGTIAVFDADGNLIDDTQITIQGAIDAVPLEGGEVVIARGTYTGDGNKDLDMLATDPNAYRPIVVRSEFPGETIIDCEGAGRGFNFAGVENILQAVIDIAIINGEADRGGAMYFGPVAWPYVGGCVFRNNHSTEGGGAIWIDGPDNYPDDGPAHTMDEFGPWIFGCDIVNNTSDGPGGGIHVTGGGYPWFVFCVINDNRAGNPNVAPAFGGGVYSNAGSTPAFINCLVTENLSTDIGGAFYLHESDAVIRLSTIMYNSGMDYGDVDGNTRIGPKGGIACRDSSPEINHCIIGRSGSTDPNMTFSWGNDFSIAWGDDLYECEATYSIIENGDAGDGNLDLNPMFVSGPYSSRYGDFYLSQPNGELTTSPAVNAGQQFALTDIQDTYLLPGENTTSSIGNYDTADCDLGFHWPRIPGPPLPPPEYTLTIYVFGQGSLTFDTFGTTDPNKSGMITGDGFQIIEKYLAGDQVSLFADPNEGYRVRYWSGTDDDTLFTRDNTVTIYGDTIVFLEFEKTFIRTINIPGNYTYTQVQKAIDDARDNDTIVLQSGTYETRGILVDGKDITITSAFPNDPDYVASTILSFDSLRFTSGRAGVTIIGSGYGTCVLNGVTIANAISGGTDAISPEGGGSRGIDGESMFGAGLVVEGDHIIANCVIRDCLTTGENGSNGNNGDNGLPDGGGGGNGGDAGGAGLYIGANDLAFGSFFGYEISSGSPIIKNCMIYNCTSIAGNGANGANGANATDTEPGGRGGDAGVPGRVMGGAVLCDAGTSPEFIDCQIFNNTAIGGRGGDGGDAGDRGGRGGWGGLTDEFVLYFLETENEYGLYDAGDPRQYTANGGSVYVGGFGYGYDYDAFNWGWPFDDGWGIPIDDPWDPFALEYPLTHAKFTNCVISDSVTIGSVSGEGGMHSAGGQMPPYLNFQIPSYGGGLYVAEDANALFVDCSIVRNVTDFDPANLDNPDYFSADHYIGYGGGVTVQGSKTYQPYVRFETCNIADNYAPVGGGMYWISSQLDVVDSNIINNRAYVGGGMNFYNSYESSISGCLIQGNVAAFDTAVTTVGFPLQGDIYGAGGGIFGYTSDIVISDTTINENTSTFSGGGVYLGGHPEGLYPLLGEPELRNCLITSNEAAQDGGGVSVVWFAQVAINNCTIVDNIVTGAVGASPGYGGGVSVGFNSGAVIKDSIIWYNYGALGAQLAVANSIEESEGQPELKVLYSTVGPFYDPNEFEEMLLRYTGNEEDEDSGGGDPGMPIPGSVIVEAKTIYDQFDAGEETVKIIVTLVDSGNISKITDWSWPASVARLQQDVSELENAVLSTLLSSEFEESHRYENFAGFSGSISLSGLAKLASNPLVAAIEPERYGEPMMVQALDLANALYARQAYDGTGITVAIVDTGVDYTHPDLGGGGFPNDKVIGGFDFGMNDPDPMPEHPHGTACAGIAAGDLNNFGDYIGGVAYGAKIAALKIMTDGGAMPFSAGLAAWDWCATNKYLDPSNPIMVVSNSWGIYFLPFDNAAVADAQFPSMAAAADILTDAGITVMAASGNDGYGGQGISFPSALSKVISVGAVFDATDIVTGYSNTADILDILAPADPIHTTDIVGAAGYDPGDYFDSFNGTSSATPFAAGCVASIQSAALDKLGRYLTPREVRSLLIATGTPVTDTKVLITKPRVNLGMAIANLSSIPIYVGDNSVLPGWDVINELWDIEELKNIMDPPDFVSGYYLDNDSNCIDAGSIGAEEVGLDVYTTQIDGSPDMDKVDMGYHYRHGLQALQVGVTVVENPDAPGITGYASIELPDGSILDGMNIDTFAYEGQKVILRAFPDEGVSVGGWYDSIGRLVSMSDEIEIVVDEYSLFTLEFRTGSTIEVSGTGNVLRQAVYDAKNGDTLIVSPGVYNGNINVQGKKLTIVSVNPNDPDVVAATVINSGTGERAFIFDSEEGSDVVVNGFTITRTSFFSNFESGGAMYFGPGTSPIIKNVRVSNSYAQLANGGAFYIGPESSPTFINVVIEDCWVNIGSGGGVYIGALASPTFIDCAIINCYAYSGAGGGVYSEATSSPVFTDCLFSGNIADMAGGAIFFSYECESQITDSTFLNNNVFSSGGDRYYGDGGAIFYGFDNTLEISDSNFIGNGSDFGGAIYFNEGSTGTVRRNLISTNNAGQDGGAVFMNKANNLEISDCAIVDNIAMRGGGLFSTGGVGNTVSGCAFRENLADIPLSFIPTDPNGGGIIPPGGGIQGGGSIAGYGGGIYVFAEEILVEDCSLFMNSAGNSGGGIYLSGDMESLTPTTYPELRNCLVASNSAGRTGGGVSCDWYVEPLIVGCTIVDNGSTSYGGGLYLSYDSKVEVINSIIWENYATDGSQIAVINDNEFDADITSLNISYSDVGPDADPNFYVLGEAMESLTITPMTDAESLVETFLGNGIEVIGIPSYTGSAVASGTFTGGLAAGIGIEYGIILTSGDAMLAEPPNISDFSGYANGFLGDPDLDALLPAGGFFFNYTNDAAVLEFDFETEGGDVFFNYVFASEEYNEFANSFFSDVFGFFIDGVNIALVPGTNIPVGINTINGGNPLGFFANNPEFYVNNDPSDGGPFYEIEYDGFTKVLTARAYNLEPGVHHIKLAIADAFVWSYDSAIFLQAGSFASAPSFGPPVYVADDCVLNDVVASNFDPINHKWDPDDHMIWDDPLFVGDDTLYGGDDPLLFVGGYMLSHVDAFQLADSNCIDIGNGLASDADVGMDGYTTRTDVVNDVDVVDLGYHYRPFELAKYELDVNIDAGSVDGPHGSIIFTDPDGNVIDLLLNETGVYEIDAGTLVTITAVPDEGYRVREWIDTDEAPAWQATSTTLLINADITIGVVFEVDVKRRLLVPTVYATIEEAVAAASPDDDIVLAPGEYYISDPDGINFGGRNLTIMSTDPDDPAIIAATIIDCRGTRFVAKRAFHFFNGEDNRSKLYGITIKNGYSFPIRGGDGTEYAFIFGTVFSTALWPGAVPPNYADDPVVRALYGESVSGDGYGGAILCENESSPTFENCVFYNNTVTGAQGGDGADGWPFDDPPYNDAGDAQPGGHAGDGLGNGYGGAVSCLHRSSPVIINCTFEDNKARGGMGGNGGDAGPTGENGGHENCGGDGGDAIGFGQGGAIYFDRGSLPIITDCTFINNNAMDGRPGDGGTMTAGTAWGDGWIAHDGFDGITITFERVWGGALYYSSDSVADITDSLFVGNKALESFKRFSFQVYATEPEIGTSYTSTRGGAIFSDPDNSINLKGCDFVENLPGAVYAHSHNWVDVDNCTFVDNSNPGDELLNDGSSFYYGYGYLNYSFLYFSGFGLTTLPSERPAGALYLGPENYQIEITDCDFRGNYTYADGGAIVCKTDASITRCSFGGNKATGYGGAIYGYEDVDPNAIIITLDFQNCSFVDNEATNGGGVYLREFNATFDSCYFITNEAENGGGLFLAEGTVSLDGGIMRGNRAVSDYALGGAMTCASTKTTIENFVIEDNVAEGDEVYGGGIMFYGADTLTTQTVKNTLFTGNHSTYGGGAIGCNIFVETVMENCTFDDNDADMFGGALFCDWSSHPKINNSIFTRNSNHAVYEEQIGGDSQITFSLFNNNPDGDMYDAGTGASYTGAAAINTVNDNGDNIEGAPLYEAGTLGDYYLAIASPAVNKGSGLSVDLGLDFKTTRTDNGHDDDIVDLGYHYDDPATLQEYQLTTSVLGGPGSITPASGTYYSGQSVIMTAIPDNSYIVKAWGGGTLNDNSRETTNIVIMGAGRHGTNPDKHITVEVAQPRVLVVGSQGMYTSIQRAIDDAEDGDIVILQTGKYVPPYSFDMLNFWNKDVTLTSMNPDDEDVVANTEMSGYDFSFSNVGPGTIIEGLTIRISRMYLYSSSPKIRNCIFIDSNWRGMDGFATLPPDDGMDGGSVLGGAIEMYNSSPEISNCRFENCSVTGGDGYDGDNGVGGHPEGFDGGWAGRAYGGAVYAAWNSNPVFTDCVFDNCFARGGNGGDGGDQVAGVLYYGGRGGNWVWSPSIEDSTYWYWWDGWEWGDKIGDYGWFYWFGWVDTGDEWYQNYVFDPYDRYYDYWKYTGLGGAFYCEADSSPTFTRCTFTNNNTYGGDSGIGGAGFFEPGPWRRMDIETAGGAIYIGDGCTPLLEDCLIRNNTADTSTVADDPLLSLDGPDDYYVSFGGGVAVEDNASPKFVNCNIQYNNACEGGGIYWANSEVEIVDCNIVGNLAYHGAGLYSVNSTGTIDGTFLTGNYASVSPEDIVDTGAVDPNAGGGGGGTAFTYSVFGQGGGYYSLSSPIHISDSVFKENSALASGGAIYYGGSDQDEYVRPSVFNSLLTNNSAGRDGGAISVNWYAEPDIDNCTISDNIVTGAIGSGFGYGGGIYVSYNSRATIIDSIIWDNAGSLGAQIAVGSGDTYGPRPSEVEILYSDIGPRFDPNMVRDILGMDIEVPGDSESTVNLPGSDVPTLVEGQMIYDSFDAGDEKVKVIVMLQDFAALRKTTDWDSADSAKQIRGAIAERQDAVLSTLHASEFTLSYQYTNMAGFAGEITLGGLSKLLDNPTVSTIEPDRIFYPMLAQGLPLMNAIGIRDRYDGTGVSIAIADTGIDYNHPMLGGGGFPNAKVIGGYDTGDNDPDPIPNGDEAHGTACAGLAAGNYGVTGDYIGGVAYNAKLYALKISFGSAGAATGGAIVAAWDWCITNKNNDPANPLMIISFSFGGGRFTSPQAAENAFPGMAAMADNVVAAGITLLASSGNDYFTDALGAPAAFTSVISVGAVYDTTDQVIPYSNAASFLDILAPSEPAYTTDISGPAGYDPGDYYPFFNGTSAACPYAAGAVASIQTAALEILGRNLTPGEVRNLLISTGVPIRDTKVNIIKPRVNLMAAIANLTSQPIYVEDGCLLHGWDPNSQEWDPDTFNMDLDPLLVGDYFLSEIVAGQLDISPAVDYGSDSAAGKAGPISKASLDQYTTRTDSVLDDFGDDDPNIVNIGYHHPPFEIEQFKLNYFVIVDPFELPDFDPVIVPYDPNGYGLIYDYGKQVELSVTAPPFGYHSVWTGSDNDFSHEPNNVVTMDNDKIVTVAFETIGYTLDVEVSVDANILPDFYPQVESFDPPGGVYYPNTEVTITVTDPPEGFQIRWEGADDGTIVDPVTAVIMNSNKEIIARYVPIQTDYYAVIIGISDYLDFFSFPFIELPYAVRDASELKARLADSPNWDEDNIYTLTNSQATKAGISIVMQELSERLDHDDVFVFYFSGYGLQGVDVEPIDEIDDMDEYLVTYEYDGIRDDELGQMLAEFATDNYVVLLETDFAAGQIDGIYDYGLGTYNLTEQVQLSNSIQSETPFTFASEGVVTQPQDLNRNERGVVLTACGVDEIAIYSPDFRHGVFTYYLLRAIEGNADWLGDNNEWVSAEEAYDYLAPRVDAYIEDMVALGNLPPGITQRPRIYDADEDNDIDVLIVEPQDREPKTWYVPGDADRIQDAVDYAKDGDVVILSASIYREGGIIIDKAITLTSTNPDKPDVVAMTVIDLSGTEAGFGVYFTANAGPDAVLNGITIRLENEIWLAGSGSSGFDGMDAVGGAVFIGTGASPMIKNCVITGFTIYAGNGGEGDDESYFADGGNGGDAIGGGIYCFAESSPTFVNTRITDCHVFGGNGGVGAAANEFNFGGGRGGWGGWARGGGVYIESLATPTFINCTISDCSATGGSGGNGGDGAEVDGFNYPPGYGGSWSHELYPWEVWGYEGDYTLYSAYGGGIYCEPESESKFIDCTISGNTTQGGNSGTGGTFDGAIVSPFEMYEIPSYGGGVYCAEDSVAEFQGCTISNNIAPKRTLTRVIDPALGYGGGIAFEGAESVKLVKCLISGNEAEIGGGIYWHENELYVEDCNVMDNMAYNGGGIYGVRGDAVIKGGIFHGNFAGTTALDPEQVVGRGGGIHLASVTADIRDLQFFRNQANTSGGGLYMIGTDIDGEMIEEPVISAVNNCLFVNNLAGRDGGGLSANWFAEPTISNCTFTDNWSTGYFGLVDTGTAVIAGPNTIDLSVDDGEIEYNGIGGGLFCGYETNATVINSIFWSNAAEIGHQIAVGTGFEFDPRPSTLNISFSDVQGGRGEPAVTVDEGCTLGWFDNIFKDPLFAVGPEGNHYLSQLITEDPAQKGDSPCVDTGSGYASDFGMDEYTTRTDNTFDNYDIDKVDMGFHYPLRYEVEACKFCDLVADGMIDVQDLAELSYNWLSLCDGATDWCDGADINTDEIVDFGDFIVFANCWMVEDTDAPIPDPAEWDIEPRLPAGNLLAVEMSSELAQDAWWGLQVEYRFDCWIGDSDLPDAPDRTSGWQQDYDGSLGTYVVDPQMFTDVGLVADTEYKYRVRVRDFGGNETAYSELVAVTAGRENDPPLPNPAMWLGSDVTGPLGEGPPDGILDEDLNQDGIPDGWPSPVSGTALRMWAYVDPVVSDSDASPFADDSLEYYFRFTDAQGIPIPGDHGHDSGWQQSHDPSNTETYTPEPHIYVDEGLTPLVTYYYRVSVRDRYHNVTQESVVAFGTPDPAVVDDLPPDPDPSAWVSLSQFFWNDDWWLELQAVVAVDPDGNGEEYKFECMDANFDYLSSDWLSVQNPSLDPFGVAAAPNYYYVAVGARDMNLTFRVRTRDQSPNRNTTDWSLPWRQGDPGPTVP